MNNLSLDSKILISFHQALITEPSVMEAAHKVCMDYRDQASSKWGQDTGVGAFFYASEVISKSINQFFKEGTK